MAPETWRHLSLCIPWCARFPISFVHMAELAGSRSVYSRQLHLPLVQTDGPELGAAMPT